MPPFRWRAIALPALLPALLFAIGEGAIIPIIPIFAHNLGASLAVAGLVGGILMIGELFGDIPSGWLVSRIGERPAMIGAALLSVVGLVICLLSPNAWALSFGVFLIGLATAVFALARHAFMTSFVPASHRARALSTLGGVFRCGYFVGPFITAGVIHLFGSVETAFWIHIVACLASVAVLTLGREPSAAFVAVKTVRAEDGRRLHEGEALVADEARGLFRTIWASRSVLLKLGSGVTLLSGLRASRAVILPLWAVSIGVSEADTALIIGVAGGVDFALFYASGQIMDRFGRMWSALPCILGLAAGHFVLAATHELPTNVEWFIGAAMLLSLANGIGSGILMTLGADLADKRNPAPFLGAWRFTTSIGGAAAPLAISGITAVATLSLAAGAMGVLGLVGAGMLLRYIPRFVPRAR
ncbi:MFS transporter [Homoserinimonas aerilata]|uniref:MFS transporter n=1 Tax=Homoserinimonas aerilata TaxID=1162970 RepID=A0A542YKI8_9MICO|nr:MFS transporter [Homoserinimonas aerilata]